MSVVLVLLVLLQALETVSATCDAGLDIVEHAFYVDPKYKRITDKLFQMAFGQDDFKLKIDEKITAWDGTNRTARGHYEWMLDHIKTHIDADEEYTYSGTKDGVVYDMHDKLTEEGGGAGYFRLRGEVEVDARTFAALMVEPEMLHRMDKTIKIMDFARTPSYRSSANQRIWLCYFRQAPGWGLPDLDSVDVTGWTAEDDGTIWQVSMGIPNILPITRRRSTKAKAIDWLFNLSLIRTDLNDWYPPSFRSWDMYWGYKLKPINGGKHTQVTLICQHNLRNWMVPNFVMNRMVGDVLADYIKTAESVAKEVIRDGKDACLREGVGL